QTAEDASDAMTRLGRAALEFKLDGARVQLHKRDDEVKIYSRSLKDVTVAVPELVERARTLPARELILDGEAIALRADGTPLPFQTTMRRFGRRLDVVVRAAEWGHGRRRGWLSNVHLGARDPETGGFVMLGKTFKGMTDEMLEWQTKRLLELEIGRDAYTVDVRPELVVEVAFNDV